LEELAQPKSSRNDYVSYLRGWAILSIIIIHLIDWSGINLASALAPVKEVLYLGVLFFVALLGSVVYIAYAKQDLKTATRKLFLHGIEIIGIYYLYNIVKFYIFDFRVEPFYWQFIDKNTFDLYHILTLKSFTAPISILLTLGVFMLISPALLWIVKKFRSSERIILGLIILVIIINYLIPVPQNILTDFLLARNNITISWLLWLLPYLIGFYIAMLGFEKRAGQFLIAFLILTGLSFISIYRIGGSWHFSGLHMYPVTLYYIFAGFVLVFLLTLIFLALKKIKWGLVRWKLAMLKLLGDSTLSIYIGHWIIIDLTYWIFPHQPKLIWLTVSMFLVVFILVKYRKIKESLKSALSPTY
jgi:peptidoglycan/LPS O-acetylase OafA/YrhL